MATPGSRAPSNTCARIHPPLRAARWRSRFESFQLILFDIATRTMVADESCFMQEVDISISA